jgi:hypothetical protein
MSGFTIKGKVISIKVPNDWHEYQKAKQIHRSSNGTHAQKLKENHHV